MADIPRQRISFVTAILLLATAVLIYGTQALVLFIPGVDVVLDFILGIFGDMIFGIWFFLLGVNYFSGTKSLPKLTALFSTAIIETVPLLNALPALPLGVATLIWAVRKEDAQNIAQAASVTPPKSRRDQPYRIRYVDDEAANDNEEVLDGEDEEDGEYQEAA